MSHLPNKTQKNQLLTIKEASSFLGVSSKTLRRWEARRLLVPIRTSGGHRRYNLKKLVEFQNKDRSTKEARPTTTYGSTIFPLNLSDTLPTKHFDTLPPNQETPTPVILPHLRPDEPKTVPSTPELLKNAITATILTSLVAMILAGVSILFTAVKFTLPIAKLSNLSSWSEGGTETIGSKTGDELKSQVLADSSILQNVNFNINVPTNIGNSLSVSGASTFDGTATFNSNATFQDDVALNGTNITSTQDSVNLFIDTPTSINIGSSDSTTNIGGIANLAGNSLISPGDLLIDPGGGGVSVGTATPASVDLTGDDFFVSGDIETLGSAFIPTLVVGADTVTDLTGSGLQVSDGALQATLGTSITTDEIDNGTILEIDLNATNDPTDNFILTYDSSSGGFTWVASSTAVITVKSNETEVGTDVTTLDFSTDFTLSASPANEVNISIADDSLDFTEFSDTLTAEDGTLFDLSSINHSTTAIEGLKLPQSSLSSGPSTGDGFLAYDTDDNQVKVWFSGAWSSIAGASTTLQQAYANDADGSNAIITLSTDDDSLIFRNPSATAGTDSDFTLQIDNIDTGLTTSDYKNLYVTQAGTFNTTAGNLTNYATYISNTSTESAGSNTLTNVGLYVTSSGADINYTAIFGDGTDSIQFSSVGDITFVDADGAASITGPAGGTLTLTSGASQDLTLTAADDMFFDDAQISGTIQLSVTDGSFDSGDTGIIDAINSAYNAATGGGGGLWTLTSGVIHPTTTTQDFAFGGSTLAASIFSIDESAGIFLFGGDQSANPILRFEATDSDTADLTFNTSDTLQLSGGQLQVISGTANADNINILGNSTGAATFTGTITSADLTGDQTWTFPDTTGDVCLSSGNCAGGAGGSKWTDSGTVTYLTSTTDDLAVGGTTVLGSMFGLDESAGNFYFGYDNSANPTFNFEATDGDAGEFGFNTDDSFYFSNANVGIGDTSPLALFTVGSGDLFQISSAGIITSIDGVAHQIGDTSGNLSFLSDSGTVSIQSDVDITGGDITSAATTNLLNVTTTTVNAFGASTAINLGDGTITGTIDIGGVTADGATTINIATNSTSADTLSIGNNNASTTITITGGDDWSITAAGVGTFTQALIDSLTLDGTTLSSSGALFITSAGGADLTLTAADDMFFDDAQISGTIQLSVTDGSFDSGDTGIIDAINTAYNAATGGGGGIWTLDTNTIYPTSADDRLGLGTQTDTEIISKLFVRSNSNLTGKSLAIFDQYESEDILTASSSAITVLRLGNTGNLTLNSTTTNADQIILAPNTTGAATFTGTITSADLTANRVYTLPDTTDGTFCLSSGNCAGGAGGSKWTDGGDITYFTAHTTDDVAIGDTGTTSEFYFDIQGADSGRLIMNPTTTGTKFDVNLETEWTNGTLFLADFASSTTQSGGDITGINLNFNTNLTGAQDLDVTNFSGATPALISSGATTTTYKGLTITGGALDTADNADATNIVWVGTDITIPNINTGNAADTTTAYGIRITPGTVTAGAGTELEYGLLVDAATADIVGGDASGDDLLLMSTTNATKGDIQFHNTSYLINSTGDLTIGGRLTFENAEFIDNETDGALDLNAATVNLIGTTTLVSDQATVALLNSTTTTVNAFEAATSVNFADSPITGTIDIGGVTSDGASTINIATNSTSADTITIGNSNVGTLVGITGGDDWSITTGGVGTFTQVNVDNLRLDGNALSSTSGDVDITPVSGSSLDIDVAGGGEIQIDGGLTDIGSGSYNLVNGDTDLGVAGDFEVIGQARIDGTLDINLAAGEVVTIDVASTTADVFTLTSSVAATNDGIDGLVINHTLTDSANSAGINLTVTNADNATGADTFYGMILNIDDNSTATDDTAYGLYIDSPDNGTSDPDQVADALIVLDNSDSTATDTIGTGILFVSAGGGFATGIDIEDATVDLNLSNDDTIANTAAGTITITPGSGTTQTLAVETATTLNLFDTQATTLNFAGAATTLNIAPTGASGSVVISGGSADTGCTLDGTTGDLTCSGSITGGTTGTVGFWTRSGTNLSPATAGDDITIDDGDFIGISSTLERITFNGTSDFVAIDDASFRVYDAGGTDYIDIAHDGTDINITSANTTALNITSTQVEIGDGTDYLQISTVGDLTFVDADGAASITGPAGGALSVLAGASQALTLTGNAASVWSTTAGDLSLDSTAGSLNLTSGENVADSIVISSDAGGIDITTASTEDIDITGTGGVNISSSEVAANALSLTASGGTTATLSLNSNGTGTAAIDINATGTGGDIDIDANDAITINAGGTFDMLSSGAFSIDGTGASNLSAASGNLTLSTITSGDLVLDTAANINLPDFTNGGAGCTALETDTSGNLTCGTDDDATPGGNDTEIQYNNGGSFGGIAEFTYNDGTGEVTMTDDLTLTFAGTENLAITSAPTADAGATTDSLQLTLTTPAHSTGTNIHNAIDLDATIGNATAGTNTANMLNIGAITGDAQVTLNAINIGALTGTGATETGINIATGWDTAIAISSPIGGEALDLTSVSGVRTTALIDINENNTTGTVPTIQWDSAETRGGFLDANLTGALGTEHFMDITTTAAWTSNLIDLNIGSAAVTGDVVNLNIGASAAALQALVVDNAATSNSAGWLMDIDTSAAWTGNMIDITTSTNAWTGNLFDFNFGNAAATGDIFNMSIPSSAVAVQNLVYANAAASSTAGWLENVDAQGAFTAAMMQFDSTTNAAWTGNLWDIDTGTGNASGNIIDINIENSTNDDVQAMVINSASNNDQDGWALDINGSGGFSGNVIDITTATSASSGNLIDLNFGNIADTGDGINISMGAAAVGAQALVVSNSAASTVNQIDITANSLVSGNLFDLNSTSTGLTTGSFISSIFTGNSTFTGDLNYFEWAPTSATTASGDIFQINIGTNGTTTGKLFRITDSGSDLFAVSETTITSALPHEFTAAGDVSVAYDIAFTNQTASFIKSNASLTVESGETFESNNLTLKTYNSGDIVFDLDDGAAIVQGAFSLDSQAALPVDDTTPSVLGASHFLENNTTNTVVTNFDDGVTGQIIVIEVTDTEIDFDCSSNANFNCGTTDITTAAGDVLTWIFDGTQWNLISYMDNAIDRNGQDIAELFPSNTSLVPGEVVKVDPNNNKQVTPTSSSYDSSAIGIVSTAPGIVLGAETDGKTSYAVGLAGRVPVRIANSSAPIKRGDLLATSSETGRAMKATQSGNVIGTAMEEWNPGDDKQIVVFLNNTYANPNANATTDNTTVIPHEDAGSIQTNVQSLEDRVTLLEDQLDIFLSTVIASESEAISETATDSGETVIPDSAAADISSAYPESGSFEKLTATDLSVVGDAVLGDVTITGDLNIGTLTFDGYTNSIDAVGTLSIQPMALGNIEFLGGQIIFDTQGNIIANSISVEEIETKKVSVRGDSAGTGAIPAGENDVFIETDMVTTDSLILVTPTSGTRYALIVSDKQPGLGFTVQIPVAPLSDITFDWLIVDHKSTN